MKSPELPTMPWDNRAALREPLKKVHKDLMSPMKEMGYKILNLMSIEDKENKKEILAEYIENHISIIGELIVKLEELAPSLHYDTLPTIKDSTENEYYYLADDTGNHELAISLESCKIYVHTTDDSQNNQESDGCPEIDNKAYRPFTTEKEGYLEEYLEIAHLCIKRIADHQNGFIAEVERSSGARQIAAPLL